MKTKPFDLTAAMNGAKLVTRDGRPGYMKVHVSETKEMVVLIGSQLYIYNDDGTYFGPDYEIEYDLFLVVPTRSINGYEYPEPATKEPELGTTYYIAVHTAKQLVFEMQWLVEVGDYVRLKRGLVHLTREAAEAHARAIILAGGGEV